MKGIVICPACAGAGFIWEPTYTIGTDDVQWHGRACVRCNGGGRLTGEDVEVGA